MEASWPILTVTASANIRGWWSSSILSPRTSRSRDGRPCCTALVACPGIGRRSTMALRLPWIAPSQQIRRTIAQRDPGRFCSRESLAHPAPPIGRDANCDTRPRVGSQAGPAVDGDASPTRRYSRPSRDQQRCRPPPVAVRCYPRQRERLDPVTGRRSVEWDKAPAPSSLLVHSVLRHYCPPGAHSLREGTDEQDCCLNQL